jgi:hypothetical protein
MSELMLPRPDNVRGRFGTYVTSDVFHIAERLQELDRRLYVAALDEPIHWHGQEYHFTVSEICGDGVERFVMRVKELDGRVIERCERMLRIPFEQRFAELEKAEAKWEAEDKQRQLDELYEQMGGDMLIQLDRCGFIDRPVSYAKTNATARRHRNAVLVR